VSRDMVLYASASVETGLEMTLRPAGPPEDGAVSIHFGDDRITLDFSDPETLERLRDLAHEGARRLRAAPDQDD